MAIVRMNERTCGKESIDGFDGFEGSELVGDAAWREKEGEVRMETKDFMDSNPVSPCARPQNRAIERAKDVSFIVNSGTSI